MGIGDSIRNAAENAMKDLGGTAEPHDDGHLPEPGAPEEDIKVHSTISEASNTMEAAEGERGGSPGGGGPGSPAQGTQAEAGTGGNILPADGGMPGDSGAGTSGASGAGTGAGESGTADAGEGAAAPVRGVPGPGGLPDPDPDPDVLRADPTEADQDPSNGMGRG